jgi:phospholipid/cholesterol/gamma-HCH transport system substrate-binding protein
METNKQRRLEVWVGFFFLTGLSVIAAMVIVFGKRGQGMGSAYVLNVVFPNASGLVSGSDVMLAGAKIGFVEDNPKLVGDSFKVAVRVKVRGDVKIPRQSSFVIGSVNLLGDKYIEVTPSEGFDPKEVWRSGEVVEGSKLGGLEDMTQKGSQVLAQLSESLAHIQTLTGAINSRLLSEQNLASWDKMMVNLGETSEDFRKLASELSSKGVEDINAAASDFRSMAKKANAAADSLQKLMKEAAEGKGPLTTLMKDKETAENLKALILNLRRSGVLFYKDRPLEADVPKKK